MEGYDGSVTIKTQLDNKELLKQVNDVKRILDDLVNRVKQMGQIASAQLVTPKATQNVVALNEAYAKQEAIVASLQEELERLRSTKTESEQWKETNKQLEQVTAKLDEVRAKMNDADDALDQGFAKNKSINDLVERLEKTREEAIEAEKALRSAQEAGDYWGASYRSGAYEDYKAQIAQLEEEIEKASASLSKSHDKRMITLQQEEAKILEQIDILNQKKEAILAEGQAYTTADTTALQERLIRAQEKQDAILARIISKYQQLRGEVRQTGNEAVTAHKEAAKHTGINFNKIVKYTFGVRSLFVLYRRLRQAAGEALKTIAQGDPEFNAAMSRLMTSWNQLKADLGTLLQPIVQAVIPTLNYVLEKLHNALMSISKVIAAIVGQEYIDKVTVQTVDYAGALDSVATSAKEAKKQLGGYDKLNVIQGGESGGFSGIAAAVKAQSDFGKKTDDNTTKVEREEAAIEKVQMAVESTFDVIMGYQDAFEADGFTGVLKEFKKNAEEVFSDPATFGIEFDDTKPLGRLARDLKERLFPSGEVVREGKSLKEWFIDLATVDQATSREFKYASREEWENAQKVIKAQKNAEDALKKAELDMWKATGGKDATKKALKNLKNYAKDAAKTIHDTYIANGGTDLTDKFKESVKNGLDEVTTIGRGMKRTILNIFGFTDAEIDLMVGDVEEAVGEVSEATGGSAKRLGENARDSVLKGWDYTDGQKKTIRDRTSSLASYSTDEQNAANGLGKSMASAVSAGYTFSATDTANASEKTKKLISGTASVKTEAERVGKELGGKLSSTLRESISFSEQDGKNAANELAKGMNAVSTQAAQNGSVLNSALQGVGKKIAEGINKGTISVPVTFTGQAAPIQAVQTPYPKVNTSVTVTLDGKTIANVVFDEAERVIKQVGAGASAGVHYVLGVG